MVVGILALLLIVQATPAKLGTPCRRDTNLVGTWRVIESTGEPRSADHPVHKHVTPTHFTVIQWDPSATSTATRAHGGTYELDEATYTETVLYGFGEAYREVAGQTFRMQARCWTSGDEWHIEANLPGRPALRETWLRVSPPR